VDGHPIEASALPNVLVVDDVQANLVAIEAVLTGLDCNLVFVQSGNEALRELLKQEVAVLLLDVHMPGMDGYEVAQHARKNPATRDVPILFLTATSSTEQNVLRGYGSGAVDFLLKPIEPTILRSKVRVFLELYASRRQLADANLRLERTNAELVEAYRELQQVQGQLVQSAKMASLGALVAGVAHEINNPLAFVLSHLGTTRRSLAQMVPDPTLLPEGERVHWERVTTRLQEMNGGLQRIADLVVKLRAFSRLDEGDRQPASISECLGSVLTILNHRIGSGITVNTVLDAPDTMNCYPGLVIQALLNLVSNAIDAVDGNGTITIASQLDGDVCVLTVRDTGVGLPNHLKDRIMEPFVTTKPVGEGTGLGLSITYSIAQKHGGSLELLDAENGGALAVLRLPPEPRRGAK
jgi:two-component system NtrC family sensor kinase